MAVSTEHQNSITERPAGLPQDLSAPWIVGKMRRKWGIVAGLGGVLAGIGFVFLMQRYGSADAKVYFMRAYLVGFMWCLGATLGCMALLQVQHVTGGKWGLVMRRLFEAGSRNLWYAALLFIPLAFSVKVLYPWTNPSGLTFHGQHAAHVREVYLNIHAWVIRAVVFFAAWGLFIYLMNRWSRLQDAPLASFDASERLRLRFMRIGAGGVLFYAITVSLAAIDWVMSLDAVWYSTIWGMIYMAGQALTAMAFWQDRIA
jgi:hypothetical protein